MILRTVGVCVLVFMAACAGANRNAVVEDIQKADRDPRLYVGHTDDGVVVLAATHYDSMSGIPVTARELGLTDRADVTGQMLCAREVTTGSHFPRWICRYKDDMDIERGLVRADLDAPRLAIGRASPSAATVTLAHPGGAAQH